jgi:transposase InsO family protein
MDERLRFVARLLDGEKMAALCREFDISRKTGYKIFQRYQDCGVDGLNDRSRRPYRHANRLPFQIGEFMLADRRYCYPLTISDFASRHLLTCEALSTTQEVYSFTVFERVFKEFGLPKAIRTDNGVPFASPNALFGLSKLSVWWLRLGLQIERIKPGHPEQNGCHERMHLTLKQEATKPAAPNFLQQQARFDDFIHCYNYERPHQALDMKHEVSG